MTWTPSLPASSTTATTVPLMAAAHRQLAVTHSPTLSVELDVTRRPQTLSADRK